MKTKELISRLQKADPSGEVEVTANGADIHFVDKEPAWYDGPHVVLCRDPEREGRCYSVTGCRINYDGEKVKLFLLDWADVLASDPDAPVDVTERREAGWRPSIDEWRGAMRRMHERTDAWFAESERRRKAGEAPPASEPVEETGTDRAEGLYNVWRCGGEAAPSFYMLEPEDRRRWVALAMHLEEKAEKA